MTLKNGNSSMDIYDLMKNYTDQYLNHINQSKIDIKILSKASTLAHSVPNIINISLQPIESITVNWMLSKCFTFFSHLQEVWRKSKFEFDTIEITIKTDHIYTQTISFRSLSSCISRMTYLFLKIVSIE